MFGKLYSLFIPELLRKLFYNLRRSLPKKFHSIRWNIVSNKYIEEWANKRLDPGKYYWLFILGCNNSGTTLLMQLLNSHPLIRGLPKEGQRVTSGLPFPPDFGIGRLFSDQYDLFRWIEESDASNVLKIRYDWAANFSGKSPGILLEKSPPNTLRSRWLQHNFNPARFIMIVRNPYAVCEGIRRRRGHSIEKAAKHWRLVHETLEEDKKYLEKITVIKYEDFAENIVNTIDKIEQFLDLEIPFDRKILQMKFKTHNIDGKPEKIQNFNIKSIERLTIEEIELITRIIGQEKIKKYGL